MITAGITVIICTYNGAERLRETIKHIAAQAVPDAILWEVIVANNASTDNSVAIAKDEWSKYHLEAVPFKIVDEPRPGKLYALQHAIQLASYEYLVICDDDNWLLANYIATAYHLLNQNKEIAALGGQGIPETTGGQLPEWFANYHSAYAVGPQARQTGFLRPRDVLWGAGLVTRRSLYLKMYASYPSFLAGQEDITILSAEDTEYCMRLILKGYKLYYSSSLVYQHFIPTQKLTLKFRDEKLLKGFDEANVILRKYYAAMRATIKTKGRPDTWLALLLISPFNYVFSSSPKKAEKAKDTLFFLLPFGIKADAISSGIKAFINETDKQP